MQWMSIARLSSARQRAMWVGWRRSCLSRCQCRRRGRSARLRGRCPPLAVFHPRRLGSRQNSLVESRPGPPTTALKGVVRLRWRRGPGSARLGLPRPPPPPPPRCRGLRLSPRNAPCHKQASASPKMELDMTFAMLAPELSRLQVTTADDSDEDMELED